MSEIADLDCLDDVGILGASVLDDASPVENNKMVGVLDRICGQLLQDDDRNALSGHARQKLVHLKPSKRPA